MINLDKIESIPISKIIDNPYQTRTIVDHNKLKTLAKSIRERGLIQPINLLKDNNQYIIIAGHRRFKAFKLLGRKEIPSIVKLKDNNSLKINLVHENMMRVDLNPIEKSNSIKLLLSEIQSTENNIDKMNSLITVAKNYHNRGSEFKGRLFSFDDVCMLDKILKSIDMSYNTCTTYLSILKLPNYITEKIIFTKNTVVPKGKISLSQAKEISRTQNSKLQKYLFERCCSCKINSRIINSLVNHFKENDLVEKPARNYKFSDDHDKISELISTLEKSRVKLSNFKIDTFVRMQEIMEEEELKLNLINVKKELELTLFNINLKLHDKGYHQLKYDIEEVPFLLSPAKGRGTMRFCFPMRTAKLLNLDLTRNILVKFKITSVKYQNEN